jgi:pSer/pThr/pTyr-binding forkhead associated (FHA) protein
VINIGRKNTNHIVVNDLRVSRTHAQIRKVKADYVIFDVGSSGGTFINANRIDQHILRPGDVISLAGYTMIFTIDQMPTGETQRNITSEIKSPDKGTDNQ